MYTAFRFGAESSSVRMPGCNRRLDDAGGMASHRDESFFFAASRVRGKRGALSAPWLGGLAGSRRAEAAKGKIRGL